MTPISESSKQHLYRHFNAEGVLLYVGVSISALNRLGQHKENAHWYSTISRVEIEQFDSREAVLAAEKAAIIKERPLHNKVFNHRPKEKKTAEISQWHRLGEPEGDGEWVSVPDHQAAMWLKDSGSIVKITGVKYWKAHP